MNWNRVGQVLLSILAFPFRLLWWVLKELAGQAASSTKRAVKPLLWPAVGLGVFFFTLPLMSPRAQEGLASMIALLIVGAIFWKAFFKK